MCTHVYTLEQYGGDKYVKERPVTIKICKNGTCIMISAHRSPGGKKSLWKSTGELYRETDRNKSDTCRNSESCNKKNSPQLSFNH